MPNRVLHIDVETCSRLDLKRVGADVYSRDPDLIVTVIAWAFDNSAVYSVTTALRPPGAIPNEIRKHLLNDGEFRAWNAGFEWAILTNHFGFTLDPAQAVCVQQKALHSGLPASLEDAGPAIGAPQHKDATARRLMLQLSKPRKNRNMPDSFWHVDEPSKLDALEAYCKQDVEAERAIDGMIADLPPTECDIAILDRKANNLGVKLDLKFVSALKALAMDETAKLNHECAGLTRGVVTSPGTQTAKLLNWLTDQGVAIADVGKESVVGALAMSWGPVVRRVLEIRQEIAKSSLKKLDAMQRCAGPEDRVRGQLAYYGAFRTGRFAGRLIQPQNFPRAIIKDVNSFTRYMLRTKTPDSDFVRCVWGKPLDAIATALRGCLIPAQGKVFVVRDLSQIEARVIAWLAGQLGVLSVFEGEADIYVHMQHRLGLPSRQAAKAATLGLGFGMGPGHFIDYALTYGVVVTAQESEAMVKAWRAANDHIVAFWYRLDDVAKDLLRAFNGEASITRSANAYIAFTVSKARNGTTLLTMLLPSGRRLFYRNARLIRDPDKGRDSIVYEGVDTYTKKWTDVRTWGSKLAENATQAVARDVIIEAGLRVDKQNFGDLVLSVHDELIFEVDNDLALARALQIKLEIDRRPAWAPDLPVASEGTIMGRYGK